MIFFYVNVHYPIGTCYHVDPITAIINVDNVNTVDGCFYTIKKTIMQRCNIISKFQSFEYIIIVNKPAVQDNVTHVILMCTYT